MLTHHGITYEMRGDELDDCSGESKYNAFLVVLLKKTTNFDIADFLVDVAVVVPVFVFFFFSSQSVYSLLQVLFRLLYFAMASLYNRSC